MRMWHSRVLQHRFSIFAFVGGRWQHVLEYSHSISAALGPSGAPPGSASDVSSDPSKARLICK
jgi:hypothetical protein